MARKNICDRCKKETLGALYAMSFDEVSQPVKQEILDKKTECGFVELCRDCVSDFEALEKSDDIRKIKIVKKEEWRVNGFIQDEYYVLQKKGRVEGSVVHYYHFIDPDTKKQKRVFSFFGSSGGGFVCDDDLSDDIEVFWLKGLKELVNAV